MPNIKSSIKSVKTDVKKTAANTVYTSKVKNGIKKIEKAIKNKDLESANLELKKTATAIDKCYSKGLIKKNNCDRQKSRLNNKVKEMNK